MNIKNFAAIIFVVIGSDAMAQAAIIGRAYDSDVNGYLTLYSSGCRDSRFNATYPFHWEATNASGVVLNAPAGQPMVGCYALNQQTSQVMLNVNGQVMPQPFSGFSIASNQNSGGGILDFLRAIGDGVNRAAAYSNNSAAQTQRNTINLTPGMTGNNSMNCTPDGRGGYNCR
jgi:hypothetical protein